MLGVTFVDNKLISFVYQFKKDLFCSDAKIGLNMVGDFIRFDTLFLVNLSIHMTLGLHRCLFSHNHPL